MATKFRVDRRAVMEFVAASPGYAQIAGTVTREGISHARSIAPVATGDFRDHIGETKVWTTRNRVRVPVYRILAEATERWHAWYVEFGSRRGGKARRSGAKHTFRKTLKHLKGQG
jgi:hypothetical protein